MVIEKEFEKTLEEKIGDLLNVLQIEQEKKPLRVVTQFGYLTYVRLFIESQRRESLRPYFPYAGFPMEWTRGDERMDAQQRIWQLQYQIQYCSSIVEEGHFMESAELIENGHWLESLSRFIDWLDGNFRTVPMVRLLDVRLFRAFKADTVVLYLLAMAYRVSPFWTV